MVELVKKSNCPNWLNSPKFNPRVSQKAEKRKRGKNGEKRKKAQFRVIRSPTFKSLVCVATTTYAFNRGS